MVGFPFLSNYPFFVTAKTAPNEPAPSCLRTLKSSNVTYFLTTSISTSSLSSSILNYYIVGITDIRLLSSIYLATNGELSSCSPFFIGFKALNILAIDAPFFFLGGFYCCYFEYFFK